MGLFTGHAPPAVAPMLPASIDMENHDMNTRIEQAVAPYIGAAMRIARGDELENI